MEIIKSTICSSQPVTAALVDRDLVVELTASDVKHARNDAIWRLERDHPEAHFDVIGHEVLERPRSGSGGAGWGFWSNPGKYRFTVRATGLLEDRS